jgi:hypothetical protein
MTGFKYKTPYQGSLLSAENNKVPVRLQNISAEVLSVNINKGRRAKTRDKPVEKPIDLQGPVGLQVFIGFITQHKHQ